MKWIVQHSAGELTTNKVLEHKYETCLAANSSTGVHHKFYSRKNEIGVKKFKMVLFERTEAVTRDVYKKGVLISQNSQENTCTSLFFNQVGSLKPAT